MIKEMRLLSAEEAKKASPVGNPVLLDARRGTLHRAGEREIDGRANAFVYLSGVRGTSGVVAQPYNAPVGVGRNSMPVEYELSKYDAAQIRARTAR